MCGRCMATLKEDTIVTNIWPLARVVSTYLGHDGKTRVVSIKTKNGIYKRPVTQLVLLIPCESSMEGKSAFGGWYVQDSSEET